MFSLLLSNVRVNLLFYQRNKIIITAIVVVLLFWALSALPVLFSLSSTDAMVELVKYGVRKMSGMVVLFAGILALFAVPSHLRNRSVKLIHTHPCPLEVWLLSHFLSATLVALILSVFIILGASLIFLVIPRSFPWAIFFMQFDLICRALLTFAFVTFLCLLFHQGAAVVIAVFITENTIYSVSQMFINLADKVEGGVKQWIFSLLSKAGYVLYWMLLSLDPFESDKAPIYSEFSLESNAVKAVLLSIAYSLIASCFLFLLSIVILKKKRLT